MIALVFFEDREKYLGYGEAAAGLGLMLGPVMGSVINEVFGFVITFFFFALFCFISLILSWFMIPKELNAKVNNDNEHNLELRLS